MQLEIDLASHFIDGQEVANNLQKHGRAVARGFNGPVCLLDDAVFDYTSVDEAFREIGFKVMATEEAPLVMSGKGDVIMGRFYVELPEAWDIHLFQDDLRNSICAPVVTPSGVSSCPRVGIMLPDLEVVNEPYATLSAWRRYQTHNTSNSYEGRGVLSIVDALDGEELREWEYHFSPGAPGVESATKAWKQMNKVRSLAHEWLDQVFPRWKSPAAYWP